MSWFVESSRWMSFNWSLWSLKNFSLHFCPFILFKYFFLDHKKKFVLSANKDRNTFPDVSVKKTHYANI